MSPCRYLKAEGGKRGSVYADVDSTPNATCFKIRSYAVPGSLLVSSLRLSPRKNESSSNPIFLVLDSISFYITFNLSDSTHIHIYSKHNGNWKTKTRPQGQLTSILCQNEADDQVCIITGAGS